MWRAEKNNNKRKMPLKYAACVITGHGIALLSLKSSASAFNTL